MPSKIIKSKSMFGESNLMPNALTIRAPMPKNIKVNTISSRPSKSTSLSFFLSFVAPFETHDRLDVGQEYKRYIFVPKTGGVSTKSLTFFGF